MSGLGGMFAKIKAARGLEWILLIVVAAIAVLMLGQGGGEAPSGAGTELEERMERVLSSIEGAGKVRVMINSEEIAQAFSQSPQGEKVIGVLVVAEGAGDLKVAMEISRAVRALTGVDASAIEVMKMDGA